MNIRKILGVKDGGDRNKHFACFVNIDVLNGVIESVDDLHSEIQSNSELRFAVNKLEREEHELEEQRSKSNKEL
jgi:hypothetical protein